MTAGNNPTLRYRAEIDGLRAVAVLPVCLYHADLPGIRAGFLGVDVFFVISGYLMASVIGQSLSNRVFSYAEFYERRARRLLPALTVVLLSCLGVGAVSILPKQFESLCQTVLATVGFSSNLLFWRKSANYFEGGTELNSLLHTWSLAVEEQFYIVFPVFLALIWRFGRSRRVGLTAGLGMLSFLLCLWATWNAPTAAFYLVPTRAWELLIGAAVALLSFGAVTSAPSVDTAARLTSRELVGGVGLAMVLASFFLFDSEMAFPGFIAAVPCFGTALILGLGAETRYLRLLLSNRPTVFVGKISYSLYLWHWPLIVFLDKYGTFGPPSVARKLAIIAASLVVATVSWRFVEEPFRRKTTVSRKLLVRLAVGSTAFLVLGGGLGVWAEGWPQRFPGLASVSMERQYLFDLSRSSEVLRHVEGCFVSNPSEWAADRCVLSAPGKVRALLWGDSFANSYAAGFLSTDNVDATVLQYTSPQCPPVLNYSPASLPVCAKFNDNVLEVIARNEVKIVLMAASWHSYLGRRKFGLDKISETVEVLKSRGVRVVLVGQSPHFNYDYPDEHFYTRFGSVKVEDISYYAEVEVDGSLNDELERNIRADAFFDPMKPLCRGKQCIFKQGDSYLFFDYGHYTAYGSKRMVSALSRYINRLVQATTTDVPAPPT